jgi:hypothetical protein
LEVLDIFTFSTIQNVPTQNKKFVVWLSDKITNLNVFVFLANILLNFSKDDLLLKIAQVCYALVICFAYPITCFAARSSVDRFLFKNRPITWTRTILEALCFGSRIDF